MHIVDFLTALFQLSYHLKTPMVHSISHLSRQHRVSLSPHEVHNLRFLEQCKYQTGPNVTFCCYTHNVNLLINRQSSHSFPSQVRPEVMIWRNIPQHAHSSANLPFSSVSCYLFRQEEVDRAGSLPSPWTSVTSLSNFYTSIREKNVFSYKELHPRGIQHRLQTVRMYNLNKIHPDYHVREMPNIIKGFSLDNIIAKLFLNAVSSQDV